MSAAARQPAVSIFAYGSNLDLDDVARWCRANDRPPLWVRETFRADLLDYRLCFDYRSVARRGGALNIEPAPGARLPGVVIVTDAEGLCTFDAKEGRCYDRVEMSLRTPAGARVRAQVYRVKPAWRQPQMVPPTRAYLDVVLRGARRHGLPPWHLETLAAFPTAD